MHMIKNCFVAQFHIDVNIHFPKKWFLNFEKWNVSPLKFNVEIDVSPKWNPGFGAVLLMSKNTHFPSLDWEHEAGEQHWWPVEV